MGGGHAQGWGVLKGWGGVAGAVLRGEAHVRPLIAASLVRLPAAQARDFLSCIRWSLPKVSSACWTFVRAGFLSQIGLAVMGLVVSAAGTAEANKAETEKEKEKEKLKTILLLACFVLLPAV